MMLSSLATDIVAYPSTWLRFLCELINRAFHFTCANDFVCAAQQKLQRSKNWFLRCNGQAKGYSEGVKHLRDPFGVRRCLDKHGFIVGAAA